MTSRSSTTLAAAIATLSACGAHAAANRWSKSAAIAALIDEHAQADGAS
jgi:hypothetical protein